MRKIEIIVLSLISLLIASCGTEKNPHDLAIERIKKWEGEMHRSTKLDPLIADSALRAYTDFVLKFPEDALSPDFLFKSAEIATNLKQYPTALSHYRQISTTYPAYALFPESLFLQASLLDNYMNDDGGAKVVYEELIAKFPATTCANDAKAAIANLGKSDAELIKEFKKKNGE